MPFKLPPHSSPLRNHFDIHQVFALANDSNLMRVLPTFKQAIQLGKLDCSNDKNMKAVYYFAVTPDNHLVLLEIGEHGGHRVLWNFGLHPQHQEGQIVVVDTVGAMKAYDSPNQGD